MTRAAGVDVVRFWEARVASGRLEDAVAWVRSALEARAAALDGFTGSELFVADEDAASGQPARIVLLTRWTSPPDALVDLESALPDSIDRAHGWYFRPTVQ